MTSNDLHFSPNGLGVDLKTKHGNLRFTTMEFDYYQNIFRMADTHGAGKFLVGSTQLNSLLIRTEINWTVLEKAIAIVSSHGNEGEDKEIYFTQWLMLCKLIAFYQETKRGLSEKVFKNLHVTKVKVPVANFWFFHATNKFTAGKFYEQHRAKLVDWALRGDDYQNQHVKFRVECVSTVTNNSELPHKPNSPHKTENGETCEKYLVERRYSEFEALVQVLQKNHKNCVVPPLPQKSWTNFYTLSESVAAQRAKEFQLFLNDVTSHPILRYSYELKAFLQSSSQGFKSFVEVYSHIHDGKLDFNHGGMSAQQQVSDAVNKIFSNTTAAVSTGATTVLASVWDTLRKNIGSSVPSLFPNPPNANGGSQSRGNSVDGNPSVDFSGTATSPSHGRSGAVESTNQLLDHIIAMGKRLEAIVTQEQSYYGELGKIGQCYKNMTEFETIPELARVLNIAYLKYDAISRLQLHQIEHKLLFEAQIPMLYMGKYKESFQLVAQHRITLESEVTAAARKESNLERKLEIAQNNISFTPTSVAGISPGIAPEENGGTQGTKSDGVITVGVSEQELHYNQLKLDVVAAKEEYERKVNAVKMSGKAIARESARLIALERAEMMRCMKTFVQNRIQTARDNVKMLEEMKAELENMGT